MSIYTSTCSECCMQKWASVNHLASQRNAPDQLHISVGRRLILQQNIHGTSTPKVPKSQTSIHQRIFMRPTRHYPHPPLSVIYVTKGNKMFKMICVPCNQVGCQENHRFTIFHTMGFLSSFDCVLGLEEA